MTHRVLVVDDHPVVVDGVRRTLAAHPDFEVAGEATSRDAAVETARQLLPDVIVLDLSLDGAAGPDLCRTLVATVPEAKILLHTAFHSHEPLMACVEAGAVGVVFKDGRDLVAALHAVVAGRTFVSGLTPGHAHAVPDRAGPELGEPLSPREYDVLCALALGRSTREIADSMHLTVNTVRSYVKSLLGKLNASSRVEALANARRRHLL